MVDFTGIQKNGCRQEAGRIRRTQKEVWNDIIKI